MPAPTIHELYVERGREIVQNAPQAYFDLDVEADGIPGYGSLRSVGSVSPWGETFYAEIKPHNDRYLLKNHLFCEAHGLERERLMVEGQELEIAMKGLDQWVRNVTAQHEKESAVLTAFNASFDFPWIDLGMKEAGIEESPFGIAGYCIKSVAMSLGKGYDWKETSKGKLPAYLVPPGDFTHNALEDSFYQQPIHFAIAGKLGMVLADHEEAMNISWYTGN